MYTKIGKLIKEKREKKKLSQRKLAELANVSHTEISRIESGERKRPAPYILRRIAPYLGVAYKDVLEAAGYEDLVVVQANKLGTEVEDDPAVYRSALEDFADSVTPEEVEKVKEYLQFLIAQREKRRK